MIVTITMNAAIDKMYAVERNEPGEVLRVRECVATPGGKGLNVARVIAAMGERSLATGLLGGHSGRWVQEALTSQGIAHDFEHVPGETRTCINIVEPNGRQTEFLEPTTSRRSMKRHARSTTPGATRRSTTTGSRPSACLSSRLILMSAA